MATGSQPLLRDGALIKTLDTKAHISFPVGDTTCIYSHLDDAVK